MEQDIFQRFVTTLSALDVSLFRLVNSGMASQSLDPVMIALSHRGLWGAVVAVVFVWLVVRRRWAMVRLCCIAALAVALADTIAYEGIKPWVGRERPCHQLTEVSLPTGRCGGIESFPSNHASNGAAIASAVATAGSPVLGAWLGVVAIFVGISRVYLGVHFPGDVVAGWCLGTLVGSLLGWFARPFVSGALIRGRKKTR